ncbi:hypothetical protein Tel_16205 [Candidatus Tenderia electrophaga]|jgi:hypothetical protein|uniref:Uncharacterized protein n=1 Tax=Candidatus Tenderia electrophaga TaxID=1748243 RepID=A0A0S2THC3_9GAMM|nr:hypothetical protein Tel_16205 [Candidatus Tenderia electrophaga]
MKRLLFLLFCLMPGAWAAQQPVAELGADFWFTPRHGDVIAARADLGAAVKQLLAEPEAYLVLRYPEGESGELWGQELQAWLVALGIASDRIELQADPERLDAVAVVLVDPTLPEHAEPLQIDALPAADEARVNDPAAASPAAQPMDAAATPPADTAQDAQAPPVAEQGQEEPVETE